MQAEAEHPTATPKDMRTQSLLFLCLLVSSGPAHAQPGYGQAPWQIELVGRASANPDTALGNVTAMAFGAPGQLVVLDEFGEFLVLDSTTANLVRRVGQQGQGPGEFVKPRSLAARENGTVVVFDRAGGSRLSTFGPDGRFVSSESLEENIIPGRGPSLSFVGSELLWLRSPRNVSTPISRFDDFAAPQLVSKAPDGSERIVWEWASFGTNTRTLGSPLSLELFAPRPIWAAVGETTVAVARTDRYDVQVIKLTGEQLVWLRRATDPVPLSRTLRDRALLPLAPSLRDRVRFPDFVPILVAILQGPEDTILVARRAKDGLFLDIWSGEGGAIGEARLPVGFDPMAGRAGLIAGRTQMPDGEWDVEILRIVR